MGEEAKVSGGLVLDPTVPAERPLQLHEAVTVAAGDQRPIVGDEGFRRGDSVGRYVILSTLGEGGMGVVYLAYDPELNRRVALKLLRSELAAGSSVDAHARLLREAQALAQLSHPNVVAVYDAGTHGERVWLTMEHVTGQTLSVWLAERKRNWREIVEVFCAAGRGLQAAHDAGLVHRDFKPSNVMVGDDGRVRVMDFGLARYDGERVAPGGEEALRAPGTRADDRITRTGAVQGTPSYMAPEQWDGRATDGRVDQFSFCVALYEALYGAHPFGGPLLPGQSASMSRSAPVGSRIPRRMLHALTRGLALKPADRWPSMSSLLAALGREPWWASRRIAGTAGLLLAASAVGYSAASSGTAALAACELAAQEMIDVWNPEREAALKAAFAATDIPFAEDVWERVTTRLDGYSTSWVAEYQASCTAHATGIQTSSLMDLRIACLERHRGRLMALLEIFATADQSVVENAVQAVASLPSVQACADAEALIAVAPPSDPQTALRVDQSRRQLAQAEALEVTGRYEQGLVLASKVRGEAGVLGYAPLEAEAALVEGSLLMTVGRHVDAEAALVRTVQLAIVHDLHAEAAEAAAKRIFVMSTGLRKSAEALATRPVAEALVQRAQGEPRLAALLHNNIGVAHAIAGEFDESVSHFEQTIALLDGVEGAPDPLIAATYNNLGNLYVEQGRPEKARVAFTSAADLFTTLFGDRHPQVAWPLRGLGQVALKAGAYDEAERYYGQGLALMEAAFGPMSTHLLDPLVGLGRVYEGRGRAEDAAASYRRAVAVGERMTSHPTYAEALEELGELTAARGQHAEARGLYERAVEANEAAHGKDSGRQAAAAVQAGEMAAKLEDHAAAMGWFERVLALPAGVKPETRAAAAVGLARELAAKPEATARVCDLLAEARLSLPAGSPLRGEAEALQASRCAAAEG